MTSTRDRIVIFMREINSCNSGVFDSCGIFTFISHLIFMSDVCGECQESPLQIADTKVLELHVLSDTLINARTSSCFIWRAYPAGSRVSNEPIPLIAIDSLDPEKLRNRI
ncbi:hypothetical protein TcasGA2_TC001212 [Tribolium castaneum]|uniref:Uncharacterized protein n=1 Tax=Tribolium castaneum TaxID=7070 RepID=D6WAS9_TRICA|nr:hypothetical protein TcasGA2_TC001212 [Tribolium castaneum]